MELQASSYKFPIDNGYDCSRKVWHETKPKVQDHRFVKRLRKKTTKVACNRKLIEGSTATTVHGDVFGPVQHQTFEVFKYFMVMIAVAHRYVRLRFIKVVILIKFRTKLEDRYLNFVTWPDRNSS